MPDPDMTAIAFEVVKAVAGKSTEIAVDGGRKLVDFVRQRLARDPDGRAALEAAREGSDEHLDHLAALLTNEANADPEFWRELLRLRSEAKTTVQTGEKSVSMDVSGRADTVNQFGNVQTVNIGQPPRASD